MKKLNICIMCGKYTDQCECEDIYSEDAYVFMNEQLLEHNLLHIDIPSWKDSNQRSA
jgi:hypothetical protein